ncbi:MAG: hypothetical protein ABIJ45_10515, partial [Candidatus Zixiibacteriota bacterium]
SFKAAIMQSEMMDNEENLYGKEFETVCDSIEIATLKLMENCSRADSAVGYLLLGHRYAYQSLWEARFGSKFSALSLGIKAKNRYLTAQESDPALYDIYLGLGSYHYWKSVKAGILRTIGLFKNEKDKGIYEVHLAIDSSLFSREAAVSSLIWIFINEEKYDSAIILAKKMFFQYPDGNNFLYPLGEAYYKSEQYEKSMEIYGELFNRLKNNPGNYFNLIEVTYYINESSLKIGSEIKTLEPKKFLRQHLPEISKKIKRAQQAKLKRLFGN